MIRTLVLMLLLLSTGCCGESTPPMDGPMDAGMAEDSGVDAPAEIDAPVTVDAPSFDAPMIDAQTVDAGEPCVSEGMYRRRTCACTGSLPEQCVGGVWRARGACEGGGECLSGFQTMEYPDGCVVLQRECRGCSWSGWIEITRGQCVMGTDTCPDAVRPEGCRCNSLCRCEPTRDEPRCM